MWFWVLRVSLRPALLLATQTNFRGPQGVWIQNGKLFVADTQNYRVLIWNSIPTSNNQPADLVLGQPNFTSGTQAACNPTQSGNYTAAANEFCNPVSVTSDGTHLFVSDLAFNRVLIWNSIPSSNDQPADVVVGQPNMTSAVANFSNALCGASASGTDFNGNPIYPPCAKTLNYPRYALSDGTRLFIADGGNDRVLIFNSIPTSNGAAADEVLGQPNFTSDVDTSANTVQNASILSTAVDNTGSVDTIPSPMSLAWDGSNLYVSDPFNQRVLVFTPGDTPLPDNSVVNWASQIIRQEGVVTISVPTGGAIVAGDTATISIGLASTGTPVAYTYTIKSNDTPDTIAQALVTAINAKGGDPNATALFAGPGTGSVYLSSKGINLGYDTITLAATTSNTLDITATASGGYLSAGTAGTGAPGMLVLLSGTNLSDQPSALPAVASLSQPLPTSLAGAQVFMDGIAAPLLSVSSSQIVAQIPYTFTNNSGSTSNVTDVTATDRNSTSIYVRTVHNNGSVTVTNATPMYIAPANPGLFSATPGQPLGLVTGAMHQPGNATAVVSIDGTIHAGDIATIGINSRSYAYTVTATDTLATITQALVNLIKGIDPQVTAAPGAAFTRVVLTALKPGAAGSNIPITGTASSGADITVTAYTSQTCCDVIPGSAITASNPAAPGELITIGGEGLGLLSGGSPTAGQPYNGPSTNTARTEVVATLGGSTAQVVSAALPQGGIGTYQIQVVVPSTLTANASTEFYVAQNVFISNTVTVPIGTPLTYESGSSPSTTSTIPIFANIDVPGPQSGSFSGTATFGGWSVDTSATISSVNVFVDGSFYGTAIYDIPRADVCKIFSSAPNCSPNPNVGWNLPVDTTRFADGAHTLDVVSTGGDGLHRTISNPFTIANGSSSNPTHVSIDRPNNASNPFQGLTTFSGWAVNNNAAISSVTVLVDGAPMGTAVYGSGSFGDRPDVCKVYPGRPGCPNVGWSILFDTSKLSNGVHTLEITAMATNGQFGSVSTNFTVANWSTGTPFVINIDSPGVQSGAFSGRGVVFGGWAVDTDARIVAVDIAIDGVSFGSAGYGIPRPDACAAYSNAQGCPNVGWNIAFDSTALSDGTHTLAVTATAINGQTYTITRTFTTANLTGSNPIRVNIDIPGPQNPTFSGSAMVVGWALSTAGRLANVQVLVDGVPKGVATDTVARPDVCLVMPSSPDCPTVGWTFTLDTTTLANGSHTLEVTGISASGQRGTTSNSFTVANIASSTGTRVNIDQPSSNSDPFEGLAQFSGWALNNNNATVTTVAIAIDGVPVGDATYGVSRPDVCTLNPNAQCPNIGWTLLYDTGQLPDGIHTLDVTANASDGSHAISSATFRVANWSIASTTAINMDHPAVNAGSYSGVQNFGGWAIDQSGRITSISAAVDGIPFSGATYGSYRPDVCSALPGFAGCPYVGYNFGIDTSLLTNGNHTLAITATSATGQNTTVSRSFLVAN